MLQGILSGTISLVLVGNFLKLSKTVFFNLSFGLCQEAWEFFLQNFYLFLVRQLFCEVIQLLKHQKQHCKPLLKIAEKTNHFFAMALFYVRYYSLSCSLSWHSLDLTLRGLAENMAPKCLAPSTQPLYPPLNPYVLSSTPNHPSIFSPNNSSTPIS
jgi:hypothetical protein